MTMVFRWLVNHCNFSVHESLVLRISFPAKIAVHVAFSLFLTAKLQCSRLEPHCRYALLPNDTTIPKLSLHMRPSLPLSHTSPCELFPPTLTCITRAVALLQSNTPTPRYICCNRFAGFSLCFIFLNKLGTFGSMYEALTGHRDRNLDEELKISDEMTCSQLN